MISSPHNNQNSIFKAKLYQVTPLLNGYSQCFNIALKLQLLTMPLGPTWSGHCTVFQFQHVTLSFSCIVWNRTNNSPWTKSIPSPVFASKVPLQHSHSHSFMYIYRRFCAAITQLSVSTENMWSPKPKHLLSGPVENTCSSLF